MNKALTQHEDFRHLQRRLLFLRLALLIGLFLLFSRIWYLQVIKGGYYSDLSEQNRVRVVPIRSARGLIFDRRGELLANNIPSFNLYATPEDTKDRDGLAAALEQLTAWIDRYRLDAERNYRRLDTLLAAMADTHRKGNEK